MRRKQRNPRRAADPIYVDDVPPMSTVLSELRSENTRLRKNIELSLQVQSAMQDRICEISRERDRRNAQLVAITKQYNRAFSGYRDAVGSVVRLRKRRRRTVRSYWKKTLSLPEF